MSFLLLALTWILCGIFFYGILRANFRYDGLDWDNTDSFFFIFLGLLGGPIALSASLVVCNPLKSGVQFREVKTSKLKELPEPSFNPESYKAEQWR